jgi:hypothetical protein
MRILIFTAATLASTTFAQAAIVSTSNVATASAVHTDSALGIVYTTSQSAANLSASFPYQTTTVGARTYASQGFFSSGITTNSLTTVQLDGYFSGATEFAGTFAAGPLYTASAEVSASDTLTFTLDSAGSVTLRNFNVNAQTLGGNSPTYFEASLILDGITYHTSASNGIYTIPVNAGTHTASYQLRSATFRLGSQAADFDASGLMTSYHQIIVTSVPEPGSAAALAVGLGWLLGTRRQRR